MVATRKRHELFTALLEHMKTLQENNCFLYFNLDLSGYFTVVNQHGDRNQVNFENGLPRIASVLAWAGKQQ